MRRRRRWHLCLLLGGAAMACGDPLATGEYRGEPLFTLGGPLILTGLEQAIARAVCEEEVADCEAEALTVCADRARCPPLEACAEAEEACIADSGQNDAVLESEVDLGVGLVWSVPGRGQGLFEQPSRLTPGLPARYTLTLHQPPPDHTLWQRGGDRYAVGVIAAYDDHDRDARLDPATESLLGGTLDMAVVYTPTGLDRPDGSRRAPGFHRVAPDDEACGAVFDDFDEPRTGIDFAPQASLIPSLLPDLDCDDDLSEWGLCPVGADLEGCEAPHPPLYCAFCGFAEPDEDD